MLNVFVGIIVDNFHKCHDRQLRERRSKRDRTRRSADAADGDDRQDEIEYDQQMMAAGTDAGKLKNPIVVLSVLVVPAVE